MIMILKRQSEQHKGNISSNGSYKEVGKLKDIGVCNEISIHIGNTWSFSMIQNTIKVHKMLNMDTT